MEQDTAIPLSFIDTGPRLEEALRHLSRQSIIAADLEADSMFHFNEQVCLIQIASRDRIYIIDPLPITDMSPLKQLMEAAGIRKIFHGADYDVRSLYRDFTISIENLFDTEIASRFLGYAETGLNALIRSHFGLLLEKKFQKKDWSQRPLPEAMITYAADDVRYLIALSERLESELAARGRLEWVLEECEALSGVRPEPGNERPLFLRLKGAGRLDPRSLAVLESLLAMRLEKARHKDRPPFKIMGNTTLLKLAQMRPRTMEKLEAANLLSRKQVGMYGKAIVQAVKKGADLPGDQLPRYPRTRRPAQSEAAAKKMRRLKHWRDAEAARLGIDPGFFFSNARIKAIVDQAPDSLEALAAVDGIKNWQIRHYGEQLIELLQTREPL
ncbi:MAG: ribonuclease D [Thermodesulfobacteriota bacterium]